MAGRQFQVKAFKQNLFVVCSELQLQSFQDKPALLFEVHSPYSGIDGVLADGFQIDGGIDVFHGQMGGIELSVGTACR